MEEWKVTKATVIDDGRKLEVSFINTFNTSEGMTVQFTANNWLRNIHADWKLGELLAALGPVKRIMEGRTSDL